MRSSHLAGEDCYKTKARGMAVLNTPLLNKGTAFTLEEREDLGLTGLLPPVISTLMEQVKAAYAQSSAFPMRLNKNIYLTALHDRNEVLFYRLVGAPARTTHIVNDYGGHEDAAVTMSAAGRAASPFDRPFGWDRSCVREPWRRT